MSFYGKPNITHEVEQGSISMGVTRSLHSASIVLANPPNPVKELEKLYYWMETQVDTSGGRFFESVNIRLEKNRNGAPCLMCNLTLGWLHGPEDAILLEAFGKSPIAITTGEPTKEIEIYEPKRIEENTTPKIKTIGEAGERKSGKQNTVGFSGADRRKRHR